VVLKGLEAINPVTNEIIPIFVSDYVMITYGTGAIMAVPGHDERDYDFAKKFGMRIIEVIAGGDIEKEAFTDTETGTLVNSGFLNGLSVDEAKDKIINFLKEKGIGEPTQNFKMKDWAFNRQRYWGEPIPIIYCEEHGTVPVPYKDLPVRLPMVEEFIPTDTGESPLANIKEYVITTCPICGKPAKRETDTMPQWAGSSWYFLRYMDPHNMEHFADKEKMAYWGPIDWYNGGMEHVTRHLIYSRFWNHFLYDIGEVPFAEPYKKRTAQGLILGEDGDKMSKSKGNVINPLDIIEEYGADTLRMYILFIGDYEMPTPWNESGVKGCRRFLDKTWRMFERVKKDASIPQAVETLLHKTIKGVSEDFENLKFNTAIAKMMTLANEVSNLEEINQDMYETMLKLLYPVSPHITEELWELLGHKDTLVFVPWPTFDDAKLVENEIEIIVSVNGKLRDKMTMPLNSDTQTLEKAALEREKIIAFLNGASVRKVIVVPNKLVNIVI